jgi:hypothetical protein
MLKSGHGGPLVKKIDTGHLMDMTTSTTQVAEMITRGNAKMISIDQATALGTTANLVVMVG